MTMPPSHAHTGTARTTLRAPTVAVAALLAKPDLAQTRTDGRNIVEADLGRGCRDLAEHPLAHGVSSGSLLERRRVRLGDAGERVVGLSEPFRGLSHRTAPIRVPGEHLERCA